MSEQPKIIDVRCFVVDGVESVTFEDYEEQFAESARLRKLLKTAVLMMAGAYECLEHYDVDILKAYSLELMKELKAGAK